jgi:hypothetical protein
LNFEQEGKSKMADESVILTWNATNWITIILMAATGFFILGLGQKIYAKRSGAAS